MYCGRRIKLSRDDMESHGKASCTLKYWQWSRCLSSGKEKAECQEKEFVGEEFQYDFFFLVEYLYRGGNRGWVEKSRSFFESVTSELEISGRYLMFPSTFLQGPLQ